MKLSVQFPSMLMVMSLSLCLIDVPAVQSQDPVFDDQEVKGKAMVNHVIKEILTNTDASCRIKCHMIRKCVSYNLGPSTTPGMIVCQLNDADRHQYPQDYKDRPGYSYRGIKKPCFSLEGEDARCGLTGPTETQEKCVCFSGYTGKHCVKVDKEEWKKLNQAPVCIGTKNNSFGTVEIPFDCQKKQLKLVHVSGAMSWRSDPKTAANWGDTEAPEALCIFITDSSNNLILLSPSCPDNPKYNAYVRVSNITVTSPELVYPEPFVLSKGDHIRIWFSLDLYYNKSTTYGTTCVDVYVRDF